MRLYSRLAVRRRVRATHNPTKNELAANTNAVTGNTRCGSASDKGRRTQRQTRFVKRSEKGL